MSAAALPFWHTRPQFQPAMEDVAMVGQAVPRQPVLASGVTVEAASLATATACRADWEALSASALEPSVFLEPAFALSAALHFAISQRPAFLLVWRNEANSENRQLVGVCPLVRPAFARFGVAKVWNTNQSVVGMPLLHREFAAQAMQSICDFLQQSTLSSPALLFAKVPQDGPTAALIRAQAAKNGQTLRVTGKHARACLSGGQAGLAALTAGLSAKQHKELRRQRRRLSDSGTVAFRSARSPADVRDAVEMFLALEARGWKGRSGSAFLDNPGQTAFLRCFTRDMAGQAKCRVDMLLLQGQPVAMGIVLSTQGHAAFWKTTYDEACAALSPGVQLCQEISARQVADPGVIATDSCAIANHPMIDRIWPERTTVADMLLSVGSSQGAAFAIASARLAGMQSLRSVAKRLYCRLRQRQST